MRSPAWRFLSKYALPSPDDHRVGVGWRCPVWAERSTSGAELCGRVTGGMGMIGMGWPRVAEVGLWHGVLGTGSHGRSLLITDDVGQPGV
jgi:hypothetical protein